MIIQQCDYVIHNIKSWKDGIFLSSFLFVLLDELGECFVPLLQLGQRRLQNYGTEFVTNSVQARKTEKVLVVVKSNSKIKLSVLQVYRY